MTLWSAATHPFLQDQVVDLLFFLIGAHSEAHPPQSRRILFVLDEPRMGDLLMGLAERHDILRKVTGNERETFHMMIHLGLPMTTRKDTHPFMLHLKHPFDNGRDMAGQSPVYYCLSDSGLGFVKVDGHG